MGKNDIPKESASGLLEKIKNHILSSYEPIQDPALADTRMTTNEILEAIHHFFPNDVIDAEYLASWLHEKGYTFFDAGKMRFEWLFKTVT